MAAVHILAIDLAKRSFQVCAKNRGGAVLSNRVVSRTKLQQLLSAQAALVHRPDFWRRAGNRVESLPQL
jgi:transposase